MKIVFDTFSNVNSFTPDVIPISISGNPPEWFFASNDDDVNYYINDNGVICGLTYEPLKLEENYQEKLKKLDIARFHLLCVNTINLLKERLKFKKEGTIVLLHNEDEDITLLKPFLEEHFTY